MLVAARNSDMTGSEGVRVLGISSKEHGGDSKTTLRCGMYSTRRIFNASHALPSIQQSTTPRLAPSHNLQCAALASADKLVRQVFQAFACEEFQEIGKSYLTADFRIECNTTKHMAFRIYAAIMIAICKSASSNSAMLLFLTLHLHRCLSIPGFRR